MTTASRAEPIFLSPSSGISEMDDMSTECAKMSKEIIDSGWAILHSERLHDLASKVVVTEREQQIPCLMT